MSSREEREAVKRAGSIGEYNRENDLDQNEFSVARYIVVDGHKFQVMVTGTQYCAQVVPGRYTYGTTLEELRDSAVWMLARAKEEAASAAAVLATADFHRRVFPGDTITVQFAIGMLETRSIVSKPFDRELYIDRVEVVMTKDGGYELRDGGVAI